MTTTQSPAGLRRGVFPNLQKQAHADRLTQPFWDAAAEDRLVVPRCTSCGTFRLPPFPLCHVCQAEGTEWIELPGTATVWSYTVVHHPLHPDLAAVCPYVSGVVELDGTQGEGARMLVNIVDCDPAEITMGSRVAVVFDHIEGELPTPRFRPVRDEEN